MKICSFLTWRHSKTCKICVTIRTFKMNISLQLPLRSSYSRIFSKMIVIRSSHLDVFINNAVLNLRLNSLKQTCYRVQFLVNLHVALSWFWPLVQNICFVTSFCWTTIFVEQQLKAASVFWEARENIRETSRIIRQISISSF